MDITLKEFLNTRCLEEEVSGDEQEGYYLGIDVVKTKLQFMQQKFGAFLNYYNFHHFLFNAHNKNTYASGSLEIELYSPSEAAFDSATTRRLVGTATFNITEYDNESSQNGNYASILKSLCTAQALKEYPQFGSLLNKEKLVRTVQGKRNGFSTSPSIKNFQKNL